MKKELVVKTLDDCIEALKSKSKRIKNQPTKEKKESLKELSKAS